MQTNLNEAELMDKIDAAVEGQKEVDDAQADLAVLALNNIENQFQEAMQAANNELKSRLAGLDLMEKIKEMNMVGNLEEMERRLSQDPIRVRSLYRTRNVLRQLRSLTDFNILKTEVRVLPVNVMNMIMKNKRGAMKKVYEDYLQNARKRLEKTKKYSYVDPTVLLPALKSALPEGAKHYALPFMLVLLSVARYRALDENSTFLTQTFVNVKNLPQNKHPEILTYIMNFCEENLNCKRDLVNGLVLNS